METESVGGTKKGRLEGDEYDARKLRDRVVDEEGKADKGVREAMKIWQDVGCMTLRLTRVAVRTESISQ
jgi:hypothetical protein